MDWNEERMDVCGTGYLQGDEGWSWRIVHPYIAALHPAFCILRSWH
jgi:hypothetical protein